MFSTITIMHGIGGHIQEYMRPLLAIDQTSMSQPTYLVRLSSCKPSVTVEGI